ncbi:ABC transporter, membrane protein [Geotalea daltonii FRC-32]|uniref:ABC transporter, membrane protein n=1 Tax=Geotalea daltonii (strain DSM 22248 / JCM 15807 / FRC-32) TaxID=316067 RepID=B9M062_GEODF|nr:ABC transporter permease [Geotalea daltonii]ACM20842.1 ABC transporter, membrane protein [Geotalea daltonii FRC-32]
MSDTQTEKTGNYLFPRKKEIGWAEKVSQRAIDEANGQKVAGILSWLAALNNRLLDYYVGIALLVLWELAPRLKWIDSQFVPAPTAIITEGAKLASSGELLVHIAISLQRTLQGLFFALIVAIPLGFILAGWFPRLTRFLGPLLRLLGEINAFSLFPLFVLFFGIGELAKFSIIFWSCLWPILFTTIAGVRGVDPLFVKLARSMGSGRLLLFFKVLLPGALPSIFTGIRLGATVAFLMLIAAEMIGASTGLGWLIHNSNVNFIMPRLYLGAVLVALLGMALNYGLHWLELRVVRWKEA